MSFTTNTVVSDGVTTQYPVAFTNGIYDRKHVKVYVEDDVDGSGNQLERGFTWINDGLIELDVAAPSGKKITIRRELNRSEPDVNYVNGAILDESNMNQSMDQLLGLIQEIFDGVGIESFNRDLDMNGFRLTNLGVGSAESDSVTLSQVQGIIANLSDGTVFIKEESQTGAQVVADITTFTDVTFTPGLRNLLVFLNGVKQKVGRDYLELTGNRIQWVADVSATDDIDAIVNLTTTSVTNTDASLVDYTPIGSTVTNVENYLNTRHIEWPAVVADNSTDNTAVIQASIDKVNASYLGGAFGGAAGKVMLPAGLIRVSGLILKKGVSLEGQGQANTVLLIDTDGGTCLKTPAKDSQSSSDNVAQSVVRGITFGIHSSLTPTVSTVLLDTSGMTWCTFDDLNFVCPSNVIGCDNTGNTLAADGGPSHWYNTWIKPIFYVTGGIGCRWGENDSALGEQVTAQTFLGGFFKGTSGQGLQIRGGGGNNFFGVTFENLNTGGSYTVSLGDSTGSRITRSNNFHGCYYEQTRLRHYSNAERNRRWGCKEVNTVETDNGLKNGRVDDEQLYLGWTRTYASARVTTPTTINKGYNMASITKVGTGIYDCVFTDALPDINYIAMAQAESGDAIARISTKGTGQVRVVFEDRAGTTVDPTSFVVEVKDL